MDAAPRLSQYKQSPKVEPACFQGGATKLAFEDLQDSLISLAGALPGQEWGSLFGGNRVIIPAQLSCSRGPMKKWFRIAGPIWTLFLPGLLFAQQSAELPALKQEAVAEVERMQTFTQQIVDQIFSYSELGFQEVETSRFVTGILEKNGF